MIEPYGNFEVSKSEDFIGDLFGLSEVLNEFSWNGIDEKWGVFETRWGDHLMIDTSEYSSYVSMPTLFPEMVTAVYVELENGETIFIENPTNEDECKAHEFVYDVVPLRLLAEKLSPFVDAGSFEISCWITENQRGICLERLKISADGRAERSRVVSGSACSYENVMEVVSL